MKIWRSLVMCAKCSKLIGVLVVSTIMGTVPFLNGFVGTVQ